MAQNFAYLTFCDVLFLSPPLYPPLIRQLMLYCIVIITRPEYAEVIILATKASFWVCFDPVKSWELKDEIINTAVYRFIPHSVLLVVFSYRHSLCEQLGIFDMITLIIGLLLCCHSQSRTGVHVPSSVKDIFHSCRPGGLSPVAFRNTL